MDIDIFSVLLFLLQPLPPQQQLLLRPSRKTMDAKKKTVETTRTKTRSMTVATRTTTIGMTTKTVPTVNTSARDTRTIVPFLKRSRRSKRRIGIGATVIRITITTEARPEVTLRAKQVYRHRPRERGMTKTAPTTAAAR